MIAVDARAGERGDTALVSFLDLGAETARWLMRDIEKGPAWAGDEADAGVAGYGDYRRVDRWDGRCPACRAAWRQEWWVDGSDSSFCHVCNTTLALRIYRREPEWLDVGEEIGFKTERPTGDDPLFVGQFDPSRWPGRCPACNATMPDPWSGDWSTESAVTVAYCRSCNLYTTVGDDENAFAWTTLTSPLEAPH